MSEDNTKPYNSPLKPEPRIKRPDETFAQFFRKPSRALTAMRNGLLATLDDPRFRVLMMSFGEMGREEEEEICFGCAATYAVQAAYNWSLSPEELVKATGSTIRAGYVYGSLQDMENFEVAIDTARQGSLSTLFSYMGEIDTSPDKFQGRVGIKQHNWQEQIPALDSLIADLEAAGL